MAPIPIRLTVSIQGANSVQPHIVLDSHRNTLSTREKGLQHRASIVCIHTDSSQLGSEMNDRIHRLIFLEFVFTYSGGPELNKL